MIKTLSKAQKMEREKFRIPRSVQDAIPIRRIFADGIFQVGNQYSKTWSFTDINYAIAGKEDKTSMFLDYSELLNALDSGASAKITIYNRRINKAEFERSVLLPDKDDGLDEYRHEFNQMLTAQVTGTSNSMVTTSKLTTAAGWKRCTLIARPSASPPVSRYKRGRSSAMSVIQDGQQVVTCILKRESTEAVWIRCSFSLKSLQQLFNYVGCDCFLLV